MTDVVAVALIAAVPATLGAIVGMINKTKLGQVSNQIDGRLTELLDITRKASHAEGMKDEKGEQAERNK